MQVNMGRTFDTDDTDTTPLLGVAANPFAASLFNSIRTRVLDLYLILAGLFKILCAPEHKAVSFCLTSGVLILGANRTYRHEAYSREPNRTYQSHISNARAMYSKPFEITR